MLFSRAALQHHGGRPDAFTAKGYSTMLARTTLLLALGAILVATAVPSSPAMGVEGGLLPRVEFLRTVFASHKSLVADFYWLKTIHLVGVGTTELEHKNIFFL